MTLTTVASVESRVDPKRPGRTSYLIFGVTAAAVQDAIDTLMRSVDGAFGGADGFANFIGPGRCEGGWQALGEVVIYQLYEATA